MFAIAVHGGAGTLPRDTGADQERAYLDGLGAAIDAGYAVL
jgi:isoaspartyl peptidase/L-asparaginase-like protein (Ntn-hydrolase superfamily)